MTESTITEAGFTVSRTFNAPRDLVWRMRAVMHLPSGDLIHWEGEYREVDPPRRLAFTLTDVPGTDPGDPVVADLEEVEGGTRVTISQPRHGFTDEQIQATIMGYGSFYDAMEPLLAALQA